MKDEKIERLTEELAEKEDELECAEEEVKRLRESLEEVSAIYLISNVCDFRCTLHHTKVLLSSVYLIQTTLIPPHHIHL